MKKIIILCLVCLFSKTAFAQIEEELPINDSLYNSIEQSNLIIEGEKSYGSGSSLSYSMRNYCKFPINKTSIKGLNLTMAVTQAMTIQNAQMNGWNSIQINQQMLSYQFLYDLIPKAAPKSCQLSKQWMNDTKHLLEEVGTTTLKDYPFKDIDCNRRPTDQQIRQAHRYSVRSFNTIFKVDPSDQNTSTRGKIYGVKRCLQRNHPVVLCIMADDNFSRLKTNVWTPTFSANVSLNTVVVIGYDDTRNAFEVMGTFGNNWGEQGFAWIRYEDLTMSKYGFEIVMNIRATPSPAVVKIEVQTHPTRPARVPSQRKPIIINPPTVISEEDVTLSGELILNEVVDYDKYRPANCERNSAGYYQLNKSYQVKDQFQLISQNAQKGSYVYVFSIDPNGKAELHYPYEWDSQQTENYGLGIVPISPVVPAENSQVVIPSPRMEIDENGNATRTERALNKQLRGTDWLVVLYSDRRLEDEINGLVAQLYMHNRDFIARFNQVFGDRLISKRDVAFSGTTFKANTKRGYIVPMIIKLEAN